MHQINFPINKEKKININMQKADIGETNLGKTIISN